MAAALTDEQIEQLHYEYAQSGKIAVAARNVGVAWSSANRYLKNESTDPESPLAKMREQKKVDISEKIGEVILAQLEALKNPQKINQASYDELTRGVGILTDKRLLLTGQATSRAETIVGDAAAVLTPEERMMAARLRSKLLADGS